ncbi:MAG: (d)CMP kinase [Candidatus Saccharimonas sp.]
MQHPLPKLVTFDGQARSGKGTVVRLVKDYVREQLGRTVMLIDAGQVFRVLVVVMTERGINLDDPQAIDDYLSDEHNIATCVQRVKDVYHMPKTEREALLYTPQIGVNSAKVGARPLSQVFKDDLLRKWLRDAREEGYEVVLLDGRALEETGSMLAREGLCTYVLGLFFVCDPVVSAQRTLGRMPVPYAELTGPFKHEVDNMIAQIETRNQADAERSVQPVVPPAYAARYMVNELPRELPPATPCPAAIVDRSIELPFDTMVLPVARLVARYIA